MEILTKNNSKNGTERVEDVESPELENESPEGLGEVKDEVSEKIEGAVKGLESGDQEIGNSLSGDTSPEAGGVREESEEIVNKGKDIGNSAKEGIDRIVDEQDPESGSGGGKEWKDKNEMEKKDEIEKYKNNLNKEELLAESESIGDRIEELREKAIAFANKRGDAAVKLQEQLKSGVDISEFKGLEQEEARKTLGELAENARNNVTTDKLRWLLEEEKPDGDLMDAHEDREVSIEILEKMATNLEKFNDYLKEFETMSEGMREEAREEVEGILKRMGDKIRKNPELLKYLAGTIATLFVLATAVGIMAPAATELLGIVGMDEALTAGIVVTGASLAVSPFVLFSKEQRKKLLEKGIKGAKGVVGAGIGAAILTTGIFNKENLDKALKAISGTDYPSWYKFWSGVLDLEDEKTSKV